MRLVGLTAQAVIWFHLNLKKTIFSLVWGVGLEQLEHVNDSFPAPSFPPSSLSFLSFQFFSVNGPFQLEYFLQSLDTDQAVQMKYPASALQRFMKFQTHTRCRRRRTGGNRTGKRVSLVIFIPIAYWK